MQFLRAHGLTVLLLAALATQLVFWEGRVNPPLPSGPLPGEPLPPIAVRNLGDTVPRKLDDMLVGGGCALLVFVSPTCRTCLRMRRTWPGDFLAWQAAVGVSVRAVWLSDGSPEQATAFLTARILPAELAYVIEEHAAFAYRDLGVLGTPTSYLVDASGLVLGGIIGDVLPPTELTQRHCR